MEVKKSKEQIKEEQRQRGYATYKKNLIPLNERPKEEELEIRRKAQKGMLESRKKKKTIKEVMDMVTALNVNDIANNYVDEDIVSKAQEVEPNLTAYDLIGLAQLQNAIKGSTKSAEFIRDSSGERPKDMQEISIDVVTDNDRAMLENINERLNTLEEVQAGRVIDTDAI